MQAARISPYHFGKVTSLTCWQPRCFCCVNEIFHFFLAALLALCFVSQADGNREWYSPTFDCSLNERNWSVTWITIFNRSTTAKLTLRYRGLVIKGRGWWWRRGADQSAGKVRLTCILPTQKMNAIARWGFSLSSSRADVTHRISRTRKAKLEALKPH